MKIYYFFFLFILNTSLLAQSSCEGKSQIIQGFIKNESTKEIVPFVNIGIVGQGCGTVSTIDGYFELKICAHNFEKTIAISCMGYETILFDNIYLFNKQIEKDSTIYLIEKVGILNEIVVSVKKEKKKKIKHKYALGFETGNLGSEITSIKSVKKEKKIESISFNLLENDNSDMIFRLNIYQLKEGEISGNILHQNIFVKIDSYQKGEIKVDLSIYNILVNNDFAIALECIKKSEKMNFEGDFNNKSFMRGASQDKWRKSVIELKTEVSYIK